MPTAENRNDRVDQQWLALIADQSMRLPLPVGLAMSVLAFLASKHLPLSVVLLWLTTVFLVLWLRHYFLGSLPQRDDLSLTSKRHVVVAMSALNGVVHAICLFSFPYISDQEKLFFTVLLLGLCTGATGTTAGHRATFLAYVSPVLIMLIIAWSFYANASDQSWIEDSIAVLIGFYSLTLLGLAKATHKTFVESWNIREKEHDLNQQLQHALAQAQDANRAKTRFLAAASHDLRQPLHTQSMLIATLSLRDLDERSTEIVQLLLESNSTFSKLLDGLLDISKLDAGIVEPTCKQFRIRLLVLQHYSEIEAVIRDKDLLPILVCDSNAVVDTDPNLLLRILRNLTDNAIKFTERGQVSIEVKSDEKFVYVTVADTGPGIPEVHHDKIFQEFYQVANPERDRIKGLGLGLSIVKRLTDLLEIVLTFESNTSSGTQFTLHLPVVSHPIEGLQNSAIKEFNNKNFSLNVLVVDDEKSVRTSIRILLEELGCHCLEAGSTAEAVMLVQQIQPDLILADFRLRGDDSGIATITAIKNKWPDSQAVLVSGDTEPDRQREAKEAGIRLLHKPLSLEQLKQELLDVKKSR